MCYGLLTIKLSKATSCRLPEVGARHRDARSAARLGGSEHEYGARSPEQQGVVRCGSGAGWVR